MKKILATSWHPGGANAIAPVIKRLIAEDKTIVVVIGYQFSEKIFRDYGINYKIVDSYGLRDVSLGSLERLLRVELPDLVLTGTSMQDEATKDVIEQTIVLAAETKGIPTLAVLDFWGNYWQRVSDIFTGEKFKFLPDKIAIMDEVVQQAMAEEGFAKERLVITGNPYFDDLPAKASSFTVTEKQTIRQSIGLGCETLLFFAGNTFKNEAINYGYWDLENIRLLAGVLKQLPKGQRTKIGIAVGLHPRTPESDLAEINHYIGEISGIKIKVVHHIKAQELVLVSDLTLTANSTVGIEAVYMGKPCISLQPGLKGKDLLIVSEKGIIPVGYTVRDCERELKKAIVDIEYREKELPKRAKNFRIDGRATERVVKLAYEMIGLSQ